MLPCQLRIGDGYHLLCHGEGAHLEWDRAKAAGEAPPALHRPAGCLQQGWKPCHDTGSTPWRPPAAAGDGQRSDPWFTAQLCLLQHPGTDGGPIPSPHVGAAGTVRACLPAGSRALSPTAGRSLAPCPGSTTLLAVLSADRSQSCFYLFKSCLAPSGLKIP